MTTWFIIGYLLCWIIAISVTPKIRIWFLIILVYLLFMNYIFGHEINKFILGLFSVVAVLKAVFVLVAPARRLLTQRIYLKAKKILPAISETERLALNAGETWYEKEIFQGNPNYHVLHQIKKFELSKEEIDFLHNETNTLCSMINDWQISHVDHDLPVDMWEYIRKNGFFGLVIPKAYGGKGFSAAAHSEIVMKIATRSSSVAVTIMVPNSLGPGELLCHYGTTEQKDYYLPRLASGEDIPCFALTGPTAGSDATSIPDIGVVCKGDYKGKEVLGIKLKNINKRYITLAPVATLVGLAFKLEDPDLLLSGYGREGITCVLLPHDHPGLEIGNRLYPLNQAFMNGTVRVKESFIPIDWIIGGQKMAGEGWRMLVECLSIGRSISLPACGAANSLLSTVTTSAYAIIREQFKVPIGTFEGVEEALAKMGGLAYMINATRQFTVAAVDSGIKPSVASAISKYHITENGRTVLNYAMDVHAGRGIIMGPNNYLATAYQAVPICITVEGANIMTRNLMIFGQGAMRCHPFIRKEYEALACNDGCFDFDKALYGHVGYLMHNRIRAGFHSWTLGIFANGYRSSKFHRYYKQISRLSSVVASVSDMMLVILGGKFKYKERLSARMGDAMSYLYMACASLKYYADNNSQKSDELFVTWVLEHCLYNAQDALLEFMDNFTPSLVGKIFKVAFFPYGRTFKKPDDILEHKLSQSLLNNCVTRESFKNMCYIPEQFEDCIGRMEVTFKMVLAIAPIKNKIREVIRSHQLPKGSIMSLANRAMEIGVITKDELDQLLHTADYVNQVIQVDEFPPFEFGPKNAHPDWH